MLNLQKFSASFWRLSDPADPATRQVKGVSQHGCSLTKRQTRIGEDAASVKDFASIATHDYEFHHILAVATGNRYLRQYLLHLHQVATRFNLASWRRDDNADDSIGEHHRIITALRKGDETGVRDVMLEHIENARKRVMGTFQQ